MSLLSISSRPLCSSLRAKTPKFSHTSALSVTTTSSSSAEKYLALLQKNGSNIEKTLNTVRAKLDISCINEVLQRCALDKPLPCLRFFIWAGLQPNYRHRSYMYGKACKLFEIDQNPRIVTDLMEAYKVENCFVNVKIFKVVLNLCKQAKGADVCLLVLRKMKEFSIRPDTTVYNTVVRLFCEKGDMDMAAELMREMGLIDLYPDMITYVAMIKGFCDVGRLEDACGLFKAMRHHGCPPNVVTYSALLDGVCRLGSLERALDLLTEMEKEGGDCKPNTVTYTSVLQNFCKKGRSMEALTILDRMEACGCASNRTTVATLIKGLLMEGRLEEAYKLIDRVVAVGSVSNGECYSSLVVTLSQMKRHEEAEKLFRTMLANVVEPDGLASSILIKDLCLKGRVLDGYQLYNELDNLGFISSIDSDIYSILLSGLCQESHLVEAAKLARLMVERRIQLKAPHVDNIVEHLKNYGEKELVSRITSI